MFDRTHQRPWQSLADYRGLLIYKTYADLRAEAARTYAGFLWWVVDPIISMMVYYVVFEIVLRRGTENYVSFLFVGLVPWRWLATSTMHGANSILNSRALMQQVYMPKLIFPMVAVLSDAVKFLVVFLVLIVFMLISGFPLSWCYLALPYLLLVQAILVTGVSVIFAGLTPFLPDIRMVMENIVRLWLFLSGVFYSVADLSPAKQSLFRLNPMTVVIESYRDILMFARWPDFGHLSVILAVSLVLVVAGFELVTRHDHTYPKLAN